MSELIGRIADSELLDEARSGVPNAERAPHPPPSGRARGALVATGAALTGISLLGGITLSIVAIVGLITGGGALDVVELVAGVLLVATHWGWIHVAEAAAVSIEERRGRAAREAQREWLAALEPYTRFSVTTSVLDDGTIQIVRVRHRPLATARGTFTFVTETELEELHSPDESGAAIAERAESLRRAAALDTERERRLYEVAADAYESALLDRGDESQRIAARRAASEALSERINQNLREPPLVE